MMRLWAYLTLNATGEPTAAGTYFDVDHVDLNLRSAKNTTVRNRRDGIPVVLHDPMPQYPIAGDMSIKTTLVDQVSGVAYLGDIALLGPTLYDLHEDHEPICIFNYNINESSPKALVCRIIDMDSVLKGHATDDIYSRMFLSRRTMPASLKFGLVVLLDGTFTDIDDVTAVNWKSRS